MTDIRSRIADALRQASSVWTDDHDDKRLYCDALADALLSLPGIAITALPAPDSTRYEGDEHEPEDRLCWMPGDDFEVSVWRQGEVQREGFGWGDLEPLSATEAHTIAAALLAAALLAAAVQAQEEQ